jgi:thioredoxin reductase
VSDAAGWRADVAVIGGGPAGLVAAVAACNHGAREVVVLDRNRWLGGILPQCIHDGFGVEETGRPLAGPEYAELHLEKARKAGVTRLAETMVLAFDRDRCITAVNADGLHRLSARAIVLATGCRERTRWNVRIPGTRPAGIYTAGVAQALINLYNIMPGTRVVILGSGDVGLIMARRMTLEGVHVQAVVEILPYSSGLPRNVVQCLQDYDIPLHLSHTVISVEGRERLDRVIIAEVDEHWTPIPGTEQTIACDTLLLSLGLIPENECAREAGVVMDGITGGPVVTERFETSIPGVFACGNCLQVYDTVDILAIDAREAGRRAATFAFDQCGAEPDRSATPPHGSNVAAGAGVRNVVPQRITAPGEIDATLRVTRPVENVILRVVAGDVELHRKKMRWAHPAVMLRTCFEVPQAVFDAGLGIEVMLCE